ncbi:MAG: sulfurtransferase TusA family protein [Pseudomonadota bacterium]
MNADDGTTPTSPVAAVIDARGLACPLPLVRLRQALMVVDPGARICLLVTDPAAPGDVAAFCEAQGHGLISQEQDGGLTTLLVAKAG